MTTLTWNEYLEDVHNFLKISENLNDVWQLFKKNDKEGNCFLIYKQKIPFTIFETNISDKENVDQNENDEGVLDIDTETIAQIQPKDLLQIDYHIVYSMSYQVPVLYFKAYNQNGELLELEEAWRIFRNNQSPSDREHMLSILTQMEHPVLFKPFLALHPCRTAELLGQAGTSSNRVLTFISLMGPFVQLQLNNAYGLQKS